MPIFFLPSSTISMVLRHWNLIPIFVGRNSAMSLMTSGVSSRYLMQADLEVKLFCIFMMSVLMELGISIKATTNHSSNYFAPSLVRASL